MMLMNGEITKLDCISRSTIIDFKIILELCLDQFILQKIILLN